jgi:hypothetical protein
MGPARKIAWRRVSAGVITGGLREGVLALVGRGEGIAAGGAVGGREVDRAKIAGDCVIESILDGNGDIEGLARGDAAEKAAGGREAQMVGRRWVHCDAAPDPFAGLYGPGW